MSSTAQITPAARPISSGRRVLAWVLLLPAAFACALTQLWPTLGTFTLSLQDSNGMSRETAWVGFDNYTYLFEQGALARSLVFAFLMVLARVLAVAILPPAIGWAGARIQGAAGALVRGLATVPMLFYLPGALGIAWFLALSGLRESGLREAMQLLAEPGTAPIFLMAIDALAAVALGVSLGMIVFGAAARSERPGRWMIIAWLVLVAAAVALAWQVVDLPMTLTGGGPGGTTTTPQMVAFRIFAQNFQLGVGAAVATLVLAPVLVLGLLVGLVLAFARPRLEALDDLRTGPASSGLALIILVVGGLIAAAAALALAGVYVMPLLAGSTDRAPEVETLAVWSDSLVSPLAGVGFNLVLAMIGGYAIGGLRPLGRQSLWLLAPFAPWMFVTPALHVFDWFLKYRELGVLGTWVSLVPPGFSVAALATISVAFFGASGDVRGRSRWLPWVAAAAAGGVWLLSAVYDHFWQSLLSGPRASTWLTLMAQSIQRLRGVDAALWLWLWAPALVIGLGLIALAVVFGGRVRFAEA